MATANVLMITLVVARITKMTILVRKHDNFLTEGITTVELPCSLTKLVIFDQQKLPSKSFAYVIPSGDRGARGVQECFFLGDTGARVAPCLPRDHRICSRGASYLLRWLTQLSRQNFGIPLHRPTLEKERKSEALTQIYCSNQIPPPLRRRPHP